VHHVGFTLLRGIMVRFPAGVNVYSLLQNTETDLAPTQPPQQRGNWSGGKKPCSYRGYKWVEPNGHSFMTSTGASRYLMRNTKGESRADVLSTSLFMNAFHQLSSSLNQCPLRRLSQSSYLQATRGPTQWTSVLRSRSMETNKSCPHSADQRTSSKLHFYSVSYISLRNVLEQYIPT
jgi:hypothetical protein